MQPKRLKTLAALLVALALVQGCFLFPPGHSAYRPIHQYALACDATTIAAIFQTNTTGLNLPDDSGRGPLHLAGSRNCTNVISLLVRKGARIEAKDKVGERPLHLAAQEGATESVGLLIQLGAQVNPRDDRGFTPLKRAELFEQAETANFLRKHGGTE